MPTSGYSSAEGRTTWPGFARDAGTRGLAGVILESERNRAEISPEIIAELQRWSTRVAFENTHALRTVAPLIDTLDRAGVRVMLLKGAALLRTIYAQPELRGMSDVDLLVHPDEANRAVEVLVGAGCRRGAALVRDDFFPRFHYEVELFSPGPQPVRIDLHARPLRPMRYSRVMPDDGLWEGAIAVDVKGATAYVARPELHLIQLAAHAAFHGCNRLTWLYDLKRFIVHYEDAFDWELFLRRCEQWRLSLAVATALGAAEDVLGRFVPDRVADFLAKQHGNWRDRLALRQAPGDAQSPARHVLCNMLCAPGVGFNLRYAWNLLTPGAAHFDTTEASAVELRRAQVSRLWHVAVRTIRGTIHTMTRRRSPA